MGMSNELKKRALAYPSSPCGLDPSPIYITAYVDFPREYMLGSILLGVLFHDLT
jgi:hypothetical protein